MLISRCGDLTQIGIAEDHMQIRAAMRKWTGKREQSALLTMPRMLESNISRVTAVLAVQTHWRILSNGRVPKNSGRVIIYERDIFHAATLDLPLKLKISA